MKLNGKENLAVANRVIVHQHQAAPSSWCGGYRMGTWDWA